MRIVKTASGKRCGYIEENNNGFLIASDAKPPLELYDDEIVKEIAAKNEKCVKRLYEEFELTIGEIAALFEVSYQTMYKRMRQAGYNTSSKSGRRNSSFGIHFSEQRKKNISLGNRGKTAHIVEYERTPEIRQKISDSLKRGYESGKISVNAEGISHAWASGKYSEATMGRGIQGYFHSSKTSRNNGDIYFRSLLELCFLIKAEESNEVMSIINEPVHIRLSDHEIYIPDFLVNGTNLVELKPVNHLLWTKDDNGRFDREVEAATSFCAERGWSFMVVYDKDIGFETSSFKRFLRNHNEVIMQYQIRFNNPDQLAGR